MYKKGNCQFQLQKQGYEIHLWWLTHGTRDSPFPSSAHTLPVQVVQFFWVGQGFCLLAAKPRSAADLKHNAQGWRLLSGAEMLCLQIALQWNLLV